MTSPGPTPLRPLRLEHDPWGRLLMETDDGRKFSAVVPVRAFPVSDRDHWISICDAQGQEVLRIDDVRDLPEDVRRTLELELAQREFVPVIRRILSATQHEPSDWFVETDRGRTTFVNSTARTTCGGSSPTRPPSSTPMAFAI